MVRATKAVRMFGKATERANEQVRAFQGACEPYARMLNRRRRLKAARSRRQGKDDSAFTAFVSRQMRKPGSSLIDLARDCPRYLEWLPRMSMPLMFRIITTRRINEEQSRRFPGNYLWPGKRRFQP